MGIFVPEAVLPSGIALSNVYMSFAGECIYTNQTPPGIDPRTNKPRTEKYQINSFYNIYKDRQAAKTQGPSNIRLNMTCPLVKIEDDPYTVLYNGLKTLYPSSVDIIEPSQVKPTSNLVIGNDTLVALYKDLILDSNVYLVEDGTCNLVVSLDFFNQLSNIITSVPLPLAPEPEPEPEEEVPVVRGSALLEESLKNVQE